VPAALDDREAESMTVPARDADGLALPAPTPAGLPADAPAFTDALVTTAAAELGGRGAEVGWAVAEVVTACAVTPPPEAGPLPPPSTRITSQ